MTSDRRLKASREGSKDLRDPIKFSPGLIIFRPITVHEQASESNQIKWLSGLNQVLGNLRAVRASLQHAQQA